MILQIARMSAALSRSQLATKARCAESDIEAIENGRATPDRSLRERLADLLGTIEYATANFQTTAAVPGRYSPKIVLPMGRDGNRRPFHRPLDRNKAGNTPKEHPKPALPVREPVQRVPQFRPHPVQNPPDPQRNHCASGRVAAPVPPFKMGSLPHTPSAGKRPRVADDYTGAGRHAAWYARRGGDRR